MRFLSLLLPRDTRSFSNPNPCTRLPRPSPSAAGKHWLTSSSSSHSEPDDSSSKKSAPGFSPCSIVLLIVGRTDPRRSGGGSIIRGEAAGLEEILRAGWLRKMVCVASGVVGGKSGERGCCSKGDVPETGRVELCAELADSMISGQWSCSLGGEVSSTFSALQMSLFLPRGITITRLEFLEFVT